MDNRIRGCPNDYIGEVQFCNLASKRNVNIGNLYKISETFKNQSYFSQRLLVKQSNQTSESHVLNTMQTTPIPSLSSILSTKNKQTLYEQIKEIQELLKEEQLLVLSGI